MTAKANSLPRDGDTYALGTGRSDYRAPGMTEDQLVAVLREAASAAVEATTRSGDFEMVDAGRGQHVADVAADTAAVRVLLGAGLGVLSEESGRHHPERGVTAVLDPLDGSTNASRGLPWYATSVCAVDAEGPLAAVVVNQVSGARYEAVRGGGARLDGAPITPSGSTELGDSIVGLSGLPPAWLGWRQFRALGAVALDLCAVAEGRLDGYLDCSPSAHGSWDYLGGMLVCQEAGALVVDAAGRDLVVLQHDARRTPIAAATPELLAQAVEARGTFPV
jgi:fructose-1,6-bisphosphatase/inositol monophosphatase family enzyme